MASSEEIAPLLPETLPEDFGDWDSEAPAAPSPIRSGGPQEWETVRPVGKARRPFGLPNNPDAFLETLIERPRVSGSSASTPVLVKQPKDFFDWGSEAPGAPPRSHREEQDAREADQSLDAKPPAQSADSNAAAPPVTREPQVSDSAPSAPAVDKAQKSSVDWDSVTSEKPSAVKSKEWDAWEADHSLGETSKPHGRAAGPEASAQPVVDGPRVSGSASSASFLVKQHELTNVSADESPSHASHKPEHSDAANRVAVAPVWPTNAMVDGMLDSPEQAETLRREADGALFQMFSAKNLEDPEERGATKRKWMIFGAGGAGSTVLLLIVAMSTFHGTKPAAKHPVPPPAEVTDSQPNVSTPTQPSASTPTPSPSELLTQQKPPATTQKQQKANNPSTGNEKRTKPAKAQSELMNDQLTAPRMISRDAQKQVAEDAPPPASSGADGLGGSGANVGVFNGHGQPAVKAVLPKAITVSSGVANGMLIEKTPLVYPPIAKAAQVSGTVELHATISKTGTIKDLQFVNGPAMLRQAAIDAVRTWRYKPFELNNEPTEIATTINVVFTLDR